MSIRRLRPCPEESVAQCAAPGNVHWRGMRRRDGCLRFAAPPQNRPRVGELRIVWVTRSIWTVAQVLAALAKTCIELHSIGLERTQTLIERECRDRHFVPGAEDCRLVARFVNSIGTRLGAKCLVRSLACQRLLGARGAKSELRIGVQRDVGNGEFRAHAWVEVAGVVINDDPETIDGFNVVENVRSNSH